MKDVCAEFQASSCDGKQAFDRPDIARNAARRRKGRTHYRCKLCGKWHVGLAEKPKRKRR